MLVLKCTKKVQGLVGLKADDLADLAGEEDGSILGAWYVNEFKVGRKKCLVFMNERTLLSFILVGVRKANTKKETLPEICLEGVVHLLKLEGFSLESIGRVIEDSRHQIYAKTDSRKVLGNMNDLVAIYEHMIGYEGGLEHCDLTALIRKINRTPQRNLGWNYSIDLAHEILASGN